MSTLSSTLATSAAAVSTNVTSHAQKLTSPSRCFHAATSTATAKMAVASSSNGSGSGADEIRLRLLYKLGICDDGSNAGAVNKTPSPTVPSGGAARSSSGRRAVRRVRQWTPPRVLPQSPNNSTPSSDSSSSSSAKVLLGNAVPFSIPLKQNMDNNDDDAHIDTADRDDDNDGHRQEPKANNKSKRMSKIAFDTNVSVLPIPLHSDYSRRLRTRLWSDRNEIRHNAARNSIEFAAEGWDWRTVTEDEQMFVCAVSGELVHPVHCRYSRGRRFVSGTAAATGIAASASQAYHRQELRHASSLYQHYRQQQQQLLQPQKQTFFRP